MKNNNSVSIWFFIYWSKLFKSEFYFETVKPIHVKYKCFSICPDPRSIVLWSFRTLNDISSTCHQKYIMTKTQFMSPKSFIAFIFLPTMYHKYENMKPNCIIIGMTSAVDVSPHRVGRVCLFWPYSVNRFVW